MLAAWLVALATISAVEIEVTPLTGDAETGELVSVDGEKLVYSVGGESKEIPVAGLRTVRFSGGRLPEKPHSGPTIQFVDGSFVRADSYRTKGGAATIKCPSIDVATTTKHVTAVLLKSHAETPKLAAEWRKLVGGERAGDIVVRRRTRSSDDGGVTVALDSLDGVLFDVQDEVEFGFGGERRKVPLNKLEGFAYFHPSRLPQRQTLCRVTDTNGSVWHVSAIAWKDDKLTLATTSGVTAAIADKQLFQLDFATGNVVFLSDLAPDSVKWEPYVETTLDLELVAKMYAPRKDKAANGRKLRVLADGPTFEKGLSVHSKTELVYRLPERFERFRATVGIDPNYQSFGDVVLTIRGDDRQLYQQPFGGDSKPQELDLDVSSVRRLTIVVDFGERWDLADYLNFCDARLTK
ncbi:MAG: NPCBM/NEW2 domain-containing protein [Pirellulaceae bacterium]|jgi:hypothetical protein|nr:NPCBM/NEW2 domain-containing protein [Pirellulaceae bacterium]MDP7020392.1 NPCBM/NEW2 domain-containing protein [Pirellulaceae bacterium]